MATAEQPKATGALFKRQRGQSSTNLKGLKWQRRIIRLMPKAVEYYGAKSSTVPNGSFPVNRIKIVEKIPEDTFRKKYCFQVGDEAEVIYFKAKTDEKRTKWMQAFRQIAIDNGNTLSEYYHTGAYGLLSNPPRWSCCKQEKRESRGCEKIVTCSQILPRGSTMPADTMIFSEEELSDTEETDPTFDESAPGLFMDEQRKRRLDTCPINEEFEPDHPMPHPMLHLMVTRSSSDAMKQLAVILEENSMSGYQSDRSIDSGFGEGKRSQVNSTNVSRSSSQVVRRRSASSTLHSQETALSEKGCQTDEDLINTISSGDIQSLRALIEEGLDPNMDLWVGCHKTTLLSLACEYGQEQLVNIISEQTELRINYQDEFGKTPLMIAAKNGLKSVVDILIERGADVDLQSFDGKTALHEAAEGGHLAIVHKLLQNKADPLMCAGEHRPYDLAVSQGHRQIAETLRVKMPKKFVPYKFIESTHLHSKVGSLQFVGFGKIVASTDSEVSLIDTNLKSENVVKKIVTGSVASLDLWKDTLILGSRCVQFINVKKFEWRLSYEESEDTMHKGQTLVAVTPHGKLVSFHLRSAALRIWEPAIMKDQLESTRITRFIPHQDIEVNQTTKIEVCSLSISMDRNAPYIAIGAIRHSEHEILIFNYEKKTDPVPYQVIRLGKGEHKSVQALSPSGRIITSGLDQKLEMFSVTTGEKLHFFSNFGNGAHISSLCFSPAGSPSKHLLVGLSTGDIKVFSHDLNEGPLFTLQQPNSENSAVTALTYSKDTLFLASGCHNGLVNIWKVGRKFKKSPTIQTQKFVVDSEGGKFISEKDGYCFVIPNGALDKAVTITHGIVPFGNVACHFPEQIVPVSNIVLICPDQRSDLIFRMEISSQHCLNLDLTNPENLKKIVLLKANHCKNIDENCVLKFEPVQEAKIYPSQNHDGLTAQVRHCCAFCFGIKTQQDCDCAVRFYIVEIKPKTIRNSCWKIEYCLSYMFATCMEDLKRRHPEEDYTITPYIIEFSPTQDHIELNITEAEKSGWKFGFLGSRQITKRSVYFWHYDHNELIDLQLAKQFPPRITLEIDAIKAKKDTSLELSFQGAVSYPGKDILCLTLQLAVQNAAELTIPTLNGFISKPTASRPVSIEHHTTHLEVLRRHHAKLVCAIKSLTEFNTLLVELFAKEIIDQSMYEKFLMKQESNPHCSSVVLSGLLLLDIYKHLEGKAHLFPSLCECIQKVNYECAEELKDDYKRHELQQPSEEAHSQEAPNDNCAHGGNTLNIGGEGDTGLQSVVKPF